MDGFIESPIFGERYLVNEHGDVYSKYSKKIISKRLDRYGYLRCNLYFKGDYKTPTIHRLVAMAFIPNPDNKPQVNHIDGDKLNNHVSNLEWVTNEENISHGYSMGLLEGKSGEENPSSTITEEDVIQICDMLESGISSIGIHRKLDISISIIEHIKYRNTWKHISDDYSFWKTKV